ncbi:MAG: thioesterase family protein [Candidatus Solibacter usitatus]|nr:thioesterase family protein [Candidatus Solibacter usitatus]
MNQIPLGTTYDHPLLVTPEVAIDFLGNDDARVLATPWMIAYMEWACRNAIKPYLDENEDSVGAVVNVKHLAATPVGMPVTFTGTVLDVEGRRVTFNVVARDEREIVGEGTHERFVINVPKFVARLALKRAGAKGAQ